MVQHPVADILATQVRIASSGAHFEGRVRDGKDGHEEINRERGSTPLILFYGRNPTVPGNASTPLRRSPLHSPSGSSPRRWESYGSAYGTCRDGITENDSMMRSWYSSLTLGMRNVPIPEHVPPPRERHGWSFGDTRDLLPPSERHPI